MTNLKKFFKSFLFIGIIVVLAGTTLQLIPDIPNSTLCQIIKTIVSNASLTIGVGLIIGYVMDMAKSSNDYISYIEERLQNILISQKYLSGLPKEKKCEIIRKCLTGNVKNHSLSGYVQDKSNKIYELCSGHLRSNIDYITTVSKKEDKVLLHTVMCYKIYRVNDNYQTIKHIFNQSTGRIVSVRIKTPNKKVYDVPQKLLTVKEMTKNQTETAYENIIVIPDEYKKHTSLSIEAIIEEYGYNHWAHLCWMSLYPTEGISYKIICKDNLIIKEKAIFDDPNGLFSTHTEKNEQGQVTSYTIKCDDWTDPYTGFSVVISEP